MNWDVGAVVTSKRHSARFYASAAAAATAGGNSGKYHYDMYVYKYYIRVHHDWQVSSAKRIRLISKPPVPVLLVFIPAVYVALTSLGTRARTLADDTLLLLLLLRNWLEKVFWKPVKLSVNCMYTYIYIILYGLPAYGEQSALFAKENNIIARLCGCGVRCLLRGAAQPPSAAYVIFDLYVNTNILYVRYICRTT